MLPTRVRISPFEFHKELTYHVRLDFEADLLVGGGDEEGQRGCAKEGVKQGPSDLPPLA